MAATDGHTLTIGGGAGIKRDSGDAPPLPYLFIVCECSRLDAPPSRHLLSDLDTVTLGRGDRRDSTRESTTLKLAIPDRWMSSQHARLTRLGEDWILEDTQSKNGVKVNGATIQRAELDDGDIVEVGHTMLVFRYSAAETVDADYIADDDDGCPGMTTVVPELSERFIDLRRIARSPIRILLLGESGCGKEVLARAVHHMSQRGGPFVAVNCAALPENLVESQLFGHVKGSFSGADRDHDGLIAAADGGTLFLDEIGDLPGPAQAAILRALQESEVLPVGATRPVAVDIRLVTATHRDIDALVESGEFRHDLYARISGYRMKVPPLRERREDIGLLAGRFLSATENEEPRPIEVASALALLRYSWPLNIRELQSTLQTAAVLAGTEPISPTHLPDTIGALALAPPGELPAQATNRALRERLIDALEETTGNISAVARTLGKDRKQIQRWLKRFEIDASMYKKTDAQDDST